MKIKKVILPLAVATAGIVSVTLTSCGGSSDNHTITFYTTSGDTLMTVLEAAAEEFHEENPDYTVEITNGYSYDTLKDNVQSDLGGGSQPCVAVCYGDHVATYLTSGKVLNFDDYVNNSEYGLTSDELADLSTYWDEGNVFKQEGRFTVPFNKSTDVVYYNVDVCTPYFEKVGIDVTDPSKWTWDKLWEACRLMKKDYPKSTPLGYDSDSSWVISYLESMGAKDNKKYYTDSSKDGENKILFNNEKTVEFFNQCIDYYSEGLMTTKGITNSYTSSLFTKYTKGTDASQYSGSFISIGSTGGASHQIPDNDAFEVALCGTPSYDGTANTIKMISQGPSLVMFDQGDADLNVATWKWVKKLLSPSVQKAYGLASGGYAPASASALEAIKNDPETKDYNKQCLTVMQNMSKYFYTSDCFDGSATAREQIGSAFTTAVSGKNKSAVAAAISDAVEETKFYTKD